MEIINFIISITEEIQAFYSEESAGRSTKIIAPKKSQTPTSMRENFLYPK